jgi:secreted trypsin-like serine protease
MICAGHKVTKREDPILCSSLGSGDSGGPLVALSKTNKWTLIGVSSFGMPCQQDVYTPSGFANVKAMLGWITQILSEGVEQVLTQNV